MDKEEYCNCEDVKYWEISKTATPIHSRCNKKMIPKFSELSVVTNRVEAYSGKNKNDFDQHSKEGNRIILGIYYQGKDILSVAAENNLSEERVIQFLEALYQDEKMQLKYDFATVQHGHRNTDLSQSFIKRQQFSKDEMDYGSVPREWLFLRVYTE